MEQQQVIYYTQTVCYTRMKDNSCLDQYYDARYYKNDQSFTIEPNEDILLVIRNCGNHWFRHALSYETRLRENKTSFRLGTGNVPFQQCLWIKNSHSTKGHYVEEGTTLSAILSEPEILFKLCHVSVHDLQSYAQHQTTHKKNRQEEEEESEEMSSAAEEEEEEEEEDSDTTTTTTTTTTTQSSGLSREKKTPFVIIDH